MSNTIELPKAPSIVGPELRGHAVIVDGRVIPKITCRDNGSTIDIIVDGRFSITVGADLAYQVAWIVAQAMAIGAGYSSLTAETRDTVFAPIACEWKAE